MTTQPEALRLADWLEDQYDPTHNQAQAAAELRRLHAELERCKQVCAATSEGWKADAEEWKAQRDALLEACRAYDDWADKTLCYDRVLRPIRAQIRAAIAIVEEGHK